MNIQTAEEKIILALDGLNKNEIINFLKKCHQIKWVKVGLELFCKEGPEIIKVLKNMEKKIFLDLKLYDIPNTMYATCYQISKLSLIHI